MTSIEVANSSLELLYGNHRFWQRKCILQQSIKEYLCCYLLGQRDFNAFSHEKISEVMINHF